MTKVVTTFVIQLGRSRSPYFCQLHRPSCLQHIRKGYRLSNALFSLRIIILSRKPITSHS